MFLKRLRSSYSLVSDTNTSRRNECMFPNIKLFLGRKLKSTLGSVSGHPVNATMTTFETLKLDNLVLRTLPVDEIAENYVRNVSGACFSRVPLAPLDNPRIVSYSSSAATLLDLPTCELEKEDAAQYLSGSKLILGSEPAAHCYCGFQFGYFAGQLGDGAAKYLGETINKDGDRLEIQLKGAGPTPYSREADGRKVLRSTIREYLCSEAMHHLGIPTTRALSCVTSDSLVMRDIFYNGHPIMEQSAVVCRIAPTFIRFGSFEILQTLDPLTGRVGPSVGQAEILVKLIKYIISTFFKKIYDAYSDNSEKMYAEFYREVVVRTAHLVAKWQCVGFCHGVLNTDNMSIIGLTIDYGPYGFMDYFNPDHICNLSDDGGRYTYANQPNICAWNLNKLAEALKPILPTEISLPILDATYSEEFNKCFAENMRKKLGLLQIQLSEDSDLINDFLKAMENTGADFTNSFRALSKISLPGCSDFQQSLDIAKEYLLKQCCSLEEQRSIYRPNMNDGQFSMFVTLLTQHPEILEQLGKGAAAIQREIERREKFEKLQKLTAEDKWLNDNEIWSCWLDKYSRRLQAEVKHVQDFDALNHDRVKIMNSANPRFILRNYIAQVAIEAAEQGDYSEVKKVLRILENPYDDSADINDIVTPTSQRNTHQADESNSCQAASLEKDGEEHTIKGYDEPPPKWAHCLKVTCSS